MKTFVRYTLLAVAIATLLLNGNFVAAQSQANSSRYFPETGYRVKGIFLDYWQRNGGLARQGYPISNELVETLPSEGTPHRVQYFERAVFEYHPEYEDASKVLLSRLGSFWYQRNYPRGAANQVVNPDMPSPFAQTGKSVGGTFRRYWEGNGGLPQFGFPISDEFSEVSAIDGKSYTVQYFERAVFELHPDNQPPYNVLLSQLGTLRYRENYPVGIPRGFDRAGLSGVAMTSASSGWAVGYGGNIMRYTQGQWSAVDSPTAESLTAVSMTSPTSGWAVGMNGVILRYDGNSWSSIPKITNAWLYSIDMISPNEGWAVGGTTVEAGIDAGSVVLHYQSGQWSIQSRLKLNGMAAALYGVSMVNANEGWAVGGGQGTATLVHYVNGTWTLVPTAVAVSLSSVAMLNANEGWAVGNLGTLLHYLNGTWTKVTSPTDMNLRAVTFSSAGVGWVVGDVILRYQNGTWVKVNNPVSQPGQPGLAFAAISMWSATAGCAVGDFSTIACYEGGAWRLQPQELAIRITHHSSFSFGCSASSRSSASCFWMRASTPRSLGM